MLISDKLHTSLKSSASAGGIANALAMSPEQKVERARKGGFTVASKMTPEQRTERARKGAAARTANRIARMQQAQQSPQA